MVSEDEAEVSSAAAYLREREWSMGCLGGRNMGQCPDCCGVHESRIGHPLYLDSSGLGHQPDCPLAAALRSLGEAPLMVGESKDPRRFERFVNRWGILDTREVVGGE